MEQARRSSPNLIVIGYDEPKPRTKATKVFEKPKGYRPPSAPKASDPEEDQLDWEIGIALEFSARAIKPLLVLPASLFTAAA